MTGLALTDCSLHIPLPSQLCLIYRRTCPSLTLCPTDNEEELSDVGSLASNHHTRLPPSAAGAVNAGAIAPGISAAHRRALGQKKVSGHEGEGSQSDSVDSPVYV